MMRFDPDRCPGCGAPPRGTLDSVMGVAILATPGADAEGRTLYDYGGETEIDWDSQETVEEEDGRVVLVCSSQGPCDTFTWPAKIEEVEG